MKKALYLTLFFSLLWVACNSGSSGNLQGNLQLKLPLKEGEELKYLKIELYPFSPRELNEDDLIYEEPLDEATDEPFEEIIEEIPPFVCGEDKEIKCSELTKDGEAFIVSLTVGKAQKVSVYIEAVTVKEGVENGFYIFSGGSMDYCTVGTPCAAQGERAPSLMPKAKLIFAYGADGASDAGSLHSSGAHYKNEKHYKADKEAILTFAFNPINQYGDDIISLDFPLVKDGSSYTWQGDVPGNVFMRVFAIKDGQKMALLTGSDGTVCNELLLYPYIADYTIYAQDLLGMENFDEKCAVALESFVDFHSGTNDDGVTDICPDGDCNTDSNSDECQNGDCSTDSNTDDDQPVSCDKECLLDACSDAYYLNGIIL